jgi:hypothetical protein
MGKLMPFTDASGTTHDNSFWVLNSLNVDIENSRIAFTFIGYKDISSYDADKLALLGAVKSYYITGPDYDSAVMMASTLPQGTPAAARIIELAWTTAITTLDTGGATFFNGAIDAA